MVSGLPPFVREPLERLVADSSANRSMSLTLALSYGARESIVDAVRAAFAAGATPTSFDAGALEANLPTRELPPLDLLVRTSGEQRISNFLLWEAAYAELYFTEVLWPDFRRADLQLALDAFGQRERRFGRTSDQIRGKA